MDKNPKKVKRFESKYRKGRTEYYNEGKRVKRSKYWTLRLKLHIKEGEDLFFHHRINPKYQTKMLILMKIWGVESPSKLFLRLIDEYYSLIQLKNTKNKIKV